MRDLNCLFSCPIFGVFFSTTQNLTTVKGGEKQISSPNWPSTHISHARWKASSAPLTTVKGFLESQEADLLGVAELDKAEEQEDGPSEF